MNINIDCKNYRLFKTTIHNLLKMAMQYVQVRVFRIPNFNNVELENFMIEFN